MGLVVLIYITLWHNRAWEKIFGNIIPNSTILLMTNLAVLGGVHFPA